MKRILGLDLGTNSIGWALVSKDDEGCYKSDIKLSSRIIPMSQDTMSNFDKGVTESPASVRTGFRGVRRLRERCLQRRERLLRVLHTMGFLPEHFDKAIGWDASCPKNYGKFKDNSEPKIAWHRQNDIMQFIFMDSFEEMIRDFSEHQPSLVADGKKIPMDWTLYYLRHKALSQPISKHELAWILLSFNQKRGYYQLRGEDEAEEDLTKKEEYHSLRVVSVEATDEKRGRDIWYNIHLENGLVYRRSSKTPLDGWKGKVMEFIITTKCNEDGSPKLDKEGNVMRSFRAPKPDDWTLQKKRTEVSIEESGMTVGSYIYNHLLSCPSDTVRGKVVRTIERKYYKKELIQILEKQAEYIPELRDPKVLEACAGELYPGNENHRNSLMKHDLNYMLVQDIIFYQRPLKSKKSLIGECPLEYYEYADKQTGEILRQGIKCIAKSNPYYQEFRLWQFIQNLRIFDRSGLREVDVTQQYLNSQDDYVRLFRFLNDRDIIKQDQFLRDFLGIKKPKGKDSIYPLRWNYVEDKEYPCNNTRHQLLKALKKACISPSLIDDKSTEYNLWHLLYSVEDKLETVSALQKFAQRYELPDTFVTELQKMPAFKKEYGAYSEKAVKRLLSLMRCGELWSADAIDSKTMSRIQQVLQGEIDPKIMERMGHEGQQLHEVGDFCMLPLWLASYVIYGRHSESDDLSRWETPEQMAYFIRTFKQHSLRNPIVEQCILETLRTVHDLWQQYGKIDEIHVELGRSMKSTADQRRRMTDRNLQNEATNMRIRLLLMELKNDAQIADVRPYSPIQQDILRIYEEGALDSLTSADPDYAEIQRISRLSQPTQGELLRYKLWLEQRYVSPYTGKPISLAKLFTPAYQIEHVIPQARFFDDSFNNKVICEAEVNQLKSNLLGMEFINKHGGQIVHCSTLGDVRVLKEEEYKQFVKEHYNGNRAKREKLLMEDLPAQFIQRQMNDSRYISRTITSLLSRMVREEDEMESRSKNVIPCTGGITDRLKKDWGLNDVWNHLVTPRFERMNRLTESEAFGHWENKDGKRVFQTSMPLELQAGFSKKRIDHRHHAMDALAIACASRQIISYLNNESAQDTQRRHDLRMQLCGKGRILHKPWETFTQDAQQALDNIVVSFKNYVRVINKASNYYQHYNSDGKKVLVAQQSSEQWAVRKPLHKETVFGHVNLQRVRQLPFAKAIERPNDIVDANLKRAVKGMLSAGMSPKAVAKHFKDVLFMFDGRDVKKVDTFYYTDETEVMVAVRKPLDETFDKKRILSITDTGIQKILLNYLASCGDNPSVAFSPEGIMQMNQDIVLYNNGKPHQPILRVRVSEPMGEKFAIGTKGCNSRKFVEAQKGTNLYFAVYIDEEGKRSYETIPLNVVLERLKQGLSPVPESSEDGKHLLFHLSPNDLVYVPTEDEQASPAVNICKDRIYKMVSATGNRSSYILHQVATSIANKMEFTALNKMERALDGQMVKAVCWKLEVDRLGNIVKVIR